MLSRVLKTADTKTRLFAYKTLVRSTFEYACQVWDPHLKKDMKKLEKIRNKSLRFIYRIKSPVSVSKFKDDTNISTLKKRRKDQSMKLFIKAHRTGVIEKTVESPHHPHNTRQTGSLCQQLSHLHIFSLFDRELPGIFEVTILVNKRNGGIKGEGRFAIVDNERREDCIYINIYV